jgi:hypothetical protein
MTSKFEYKGYWYLPNKQENAIAGILTYIPNETLKLELFGTLDKTRPDLTDIINHMEGERVSVIWGETSDAKKVTLLNCIPSGAKQNFDCSFPILCFSIRNCLIGYHHLEEFEEKVFDWSRVEIPGLTMWCFPGVLKTQLSSSTRNKSINHTSVSFCREELQDPIVSVPINETTSLNLMKGVQFQQEANNTTFKQSTYLKIRKNQKTTVSEFLADIRQYESFMSLASLSELNASKILLYDDTVHQEITENERLYHPTELIYVHNNSEFEPKKMYSFLFDYSQIKDLYNDIIVKWYNDTSQILPIRTHLIQSLERKRFFSSVDFLIIIQAIEGFCIRFRKEQSLKRIVEDILEEFKDIQKVKELKLNIEEVVDSRHYYSHFMNKSNKPKALDGRDLYELTQKLRIILICCVLNQTGFCNKDIDDIFKKSYNNKL